MAEPGFRWVWPFKIEQVLSVNVVPETMQVGPQSLTTRDGMSVVITTVNTFSIDEVKVFLLEIEGAGQVIEDATYGIVAQFVMARTWDELHAGDMDIANELTKTVRRAARKYGVNVRSVQIADFTRSRSYRIMQQVTAHGAQVHHT